MQKDFFDFLSEILSCRKLVRDPFNSWCLDPHILVKYSPVMKLKIKTFTIFKYDFRVLLYIRRKHIRFEK